MSYTYVTHYKERGIGLYASIVVNVTYFHKQEPDPTADNYWDYKGYTDLEWEIESISIHEEISGDLITTIEEPAVEYVEYNFDVTEEIISSWLENLLIEE